MKGIALLFPTLFFLFLVPIKAQEVQWASNIVVFSSQYGTSDYSAQQALGMPNSLSAESFHELAWSPAKEKNITNEYLLVGFDNPMRIQQVAVVESYNPGAISRITLYYTDGEKERIFENKFPRQVLAPTRIFRFNFPMTDRAVEGVKIELKTKSVNGYNQIDAVAISDSEEPIEQSASNRVTSNIRVSEEAEKLKEAINASSSERMPIISPDGRSLYFARKDHPQNIGEKNNDDIWVSYLGNNGEWSVAVNIGAPLNNKDHNFVVAVAPSNDILYLANEYDANGGDGVSITRRQGRSWSKPKALSIENHYNLSAFVNYHLNIDGTILLMAVERNDGLGDMDLFVSFQKEDNTWSEPKNLGATINTSEVESSVFLAADEKTIYFSSNGHEGEGGLDMFMSRRLDDSWTNWSTPQNLGPRINSSKNDYNYTIPASGEYAYFAADDEFGNSDIYRIRIPERLLPEPVAILSGKVINAITNEPIKATLKLQHLNSDKETELESKANGEYMVVLPVGINVSLFAERNGYFSVSESMELTDRYLEEEDNDSNIAVQELTEKGQKFAKAEELRLRLGKLERDLDRYDEQRQEKINVKLSLDRDIDDRRLEPLRKEYNSAIRSSHKRATNTREGSQEDSELEAMKRKFNQHNDKDDDFQTKGGRSDKKMSKEDAELEAMKRKFNKYNKRDPNKGEDGEEYMDIEVGAGETVMDAHVDDADFGFKQVKEEAWAEIVQYQTKYAQVALRRDLLNEIARELEIQWSLNTIDRLEFRQEVSDLEREIKKELKSYKPKSYNQIDRGTDIGSVEYELRRELEREIRRAVKSKWREPIKRQLKSELAYRYKKGEEMDLNKDLQIQQKKELKAEKRISKQKSNPAIREKGIAEINKVVEYQEINRDIRLLPIKKGTLIPMNNVFFEANASTLKPESNDELNRVLSFLERNKSIKVEVRGHTNGWCSNEFADQLSTQRAQVVAQFFTNKGIAKDRVQFKGYGKNNPIATNDTVQGRKENQRVELKITFVGKSNGQ